MITPVQYILCHKLFLSLLKHFWLDAICILLCCTQKSVHGKSLFFFLNWRNKYSRFELERKNIQLSVPVGMALNKASHI